MGDQSNDELLFLREVAYRMSHGVEVRQRKRGLFTYNDIFLGNDAVEWLLADSKSGAKDLDGALQLGQNLIDSGFIVRVSRELKNGHFSKMKVKRHFRGGDSYYRFDRLRISPYHLHVVVRRAQGLRAMDTFSKNDPYVKLRLGLQRAETHVERNTDHPCWNEHFVFGVSSLESQQLRIAVCDYDSFKHDELIGVCQVCLSEVPIFDGDIKRPTDGTRAISDGGVSPSPMQGVLTGLVGNGVLNGSAHDSANGSEGHRSKRTLSDVLFSTEVPGGALVNGIINGSNGSANGSLGGSSGGGRRHMARAYSVDLSSHAAVGSSEGELGDGLLGSDEHLVIYDLHRPGKKKKEKRPKSSGGGHSPNGTANGNGNGGESDTESDVGELAERGPGTVTGQIGCKLWLTSFEPRHLVAAGVKKLIVRCRIVELQGVTSAEERNHIAVHPGGCRNRVCMMVNSDKVGTSHFEKKQKSLQTTFEGTLISLTAKASQATDMLKIVIYQKTIDIGEKAVAALAIPLRVVPMVDEKAAGVSVGSALPGLGEPPDAWYNLQTLAGAFTNKTMGNGKIRMSLWLALSGDDLLGDEDPEDTEAAAVAAAIPPLDPPPPLGTICTSKDVDCGYRRLRHALLDTSSKLMAEYAAVMGTSERTVTEWRMPDGSVPDKDHLAGCTRSSSYIIPRSAVVAANHATEDHTLLVDDPGGFVLDVHVYTPEVPFGSTFHVHWQMVLTRVELTKSHLRVSSCTEFKSRPFIASQIEAGVAKGTITNFSTLQEIIDSALNGGGGKRRVAAVSAGGGRWLLRLAGAAAALLLLATVGPRVLVKAGLWSSPAAALEERQVLLAAVNHSRAVAAGAAGSLAGESAAVAPSAAAADSCLQEDGAAQACGVSSGDGRERGADAAAEA